MLKPVDCSAAPSHSTKTCLVADDHPALTRFVGRLLLERGFEVLATVTDGVDALDEIVRLRPDIAVLDLSMPNLSGIEVARQRRSRALRPPCCSTPATARSCCCERRSPP